MNATKAWASLKVTYASRAEIIVEMVGKYLIEVRRETAALLGGDDFSIMHFSAVKSYPYIIHRVDKINYEQSN